MAEHVTLELPLTARYAVTVRAVAASMASAVGLSVDDIEDLRLGVNEAVSLLTDVDDEDLGDDARLHVTFEVEPGRIAVSARRSGLSASVSEPEIDVLARRILDTVVDEFSLGADGAVLLVKRVSIDAPS